MLAAGTGIAPMMQLIQQIVQNEDDETFVRLVYASKTYADILLKSELDQLTSHWNFTVLYVLSQVHTCSLFNNFQWALYFL